MTDITGLMTSNSHDFTGCKKRKLPRMSVMIVTRTNVFINPRRACAARVTVLGLCVCVCVCVSVTQHLTFHVIIRATNDTNLLSGG